MKRPSMGRARPHAAGLCVLLVLSIAAQAQATPPGPSQSPPQQTSPKDEDQALNLADLAPEPAPMQPGKTWHGHAELAWGRTAQRSLTAGPAWEAQQRQSLVLQAEFQTSAAWRWVGAARLDHSDPAQQPYPQTLLSLQEAYASWRLDDGLLLDAGRINARQGLGTGYNPSDFLRAGALRSQVSVEPASLKTNRLGTAMLRVQRLWDGGALTALLAPKLAASPSQRGLSADLGATNDRSRWMLTWSQRWSENLQPQCSLFGADGQEPQLGFNLSSLAGQAGVVYLEWAGGQALDQVAQALGDPRAARHWQQRLAAGLRYTGANKLSLTLEWTHDGAAPDREAWQRLQTQPGAYLAYRRWAHAAQELNTRGQWGVYANWPDLLGWQHLDFNGLLRYNPEDHSRMSWLELRYRWPGIDLALQWQSNQGRPGSEYGSLPQARAWQLSLRSYF